MPIHADLGVDVKVVQQHELPGQGVMIGCDFFSKKGQAGITVAERARSLGWLPTSIVFLTVSAGSTGDVESVFGRIKSLITEFQTAKKILDCIGLPPQPIRLPFSTTRSTLPYEPLALRRQAGAVPRNATRLFSRPRTSTPWHLSLRRPCRPVLLNGRVTPYNLSHTP